MNDIKTSSVRRRPDNKQLIILLIVAVFFSMIGRTIISPLMPYLQQDLNISLGTVGTLFLWSSISYSLVMVFSGYLTAWIGHGNTIVAALVMIAAGLVVSSVAGNEVVLGVGMILIGAGGGTYAPSGIAMINTRVAIEKRSTAFSFHETGSNGAVLLAPLIVLATVPFLGWHGILMALALLAALAAIVFYYFGAAESGVGAKPNLRTVGTILRLPDAYVAMLVISTSISGMHGVYSIMPAYLVEHSTWSPEHVNFLITLSRVISLSFLFMAGPIIKLLGKRNTIISILLFTAVVTGLISVAEGPMLQAVVILQPALIGVMFPAQLSCIAEIGEAWYQNVTVSLTITFGMIAGAGIVPAMVGRLGDMGIGWCGFVVISAIMFVTVFVLLLNPSFGRER